MERSRSTFNVMRSITVVMNSTSASSVPSLISTLTMFSSSEMDRFLFSQYSRRVRVSVRPKSTWACSHFSCKRELTTGTCGVTVIRKVFGIHHGNFSV